MNKLHFTQKLQYITFSTVRNEWNQSKELEGKCKDKYYIKTSYGKASLKHLKGSSENSHWQNFMLKRNLIMKCSLINIVFQTMFVK